MSAAAGYAGRAAFVPTYRPRASALHSARAGLASAYCAALAVPALVYDHPLVLAATIAAIVAAGAAARVGSELVAAARLAVPLALLIALVNPIASQQGETLLLRGGEVLGRRLDVTLEALAFGAVAGVRVVTLVLAFALLSACVDPDELLRLFRRVSYRSALTASLTVRLVPLLARDALRMGDAARCRAEPAGRTAVARAALGGALDRAVDSAAALEVRGYANARRPARVRRRWSRHDARVVAAAVAVACVAVGARLAGAGEADPYPTFEVALGPGELALAAALPALALAPLAGRLGVGRG